MKTAVILAAGHGTKAWPYAEIRPKCMIPIANRPLVDYATRALLAAGFAKIVIVAGRFAGEFRNLYTGRDEIVIVEDKAVTGTANSLLLAQPHIDEAEFVALYGDTLVTEADVQRLASAHANAALVAEIAQDSGAVIGCSISDRKIKKILGHARDMDTEYFFCGFKLRTDFFAALAANSGRFTNIQVGMMSPVESFIEMSLADAIAQGETVAAVVAQDPVFDVDKPWHILAAGEHECARQTGLLTAHDLAEGASIDPAADVRGFVRLGKNSSIGRNVTVEGNLIVGDDTTIENGAIIREGCVIGNRCRIANYCYVDAFSTIGDRCVINHCAELSGIILRSVYLYHYMEFYGILGENVDLGAATVCGTLRFDDQETIHHVKSRRELHATHSNATYIGDYCRTGVNAILMPGVKIGVYSVIGAGVLLNRDVKNNSLIYVEQTLAEKRWGPEKYGW